MGVLASLSYVGIEGCFIIKYEMDKQRELRVHNDASLVTGSVKLNDDYTGGLLEFPRQKFNNKDIPVGKCLLFVSSNSWSFFIIIREWNEVQFNHLE